MAEDTLKRNRDEDAAPGTADAAQAASTVEEDADDGDMVGPVAPPQVKKRKVERDTMLAK